MNPISEQEARKLVIDATKRLVAEGLVARTWGNISARIDDKYFIITPSGLDYEVMTEADLVKVAIEDCSYEPEVLIDGKIVNVKPSSEKGIHADAYKIRPEINFVIHTHQHFATAISAAGKDTEIAPCADYALSGTGKLRTAVAKVYVQEKPADTSAGQTNGQESCGKPADTSAGQTDGQESSGKPAGKFYKSFLMERHGAVCLGTSAEDAFDEALRLEDFCKKLFEEKVGTEGASVATETANAAQTASAEAATAEAQTASAEAATAEAQAATAEAQTASVPTITFAKPYLDDYAQMIGFGKKAPEGEDIKAVIMVAKKNLTASRYAKDAGPLGFFDVTLQHLVYKKKYSKLKDKK